MNTSNPRQMHILWGKEGFRDVAPQASAIPGFATARLCFYCSTTSCARTSRSWNQSRKAPQCPGVTKPLPTQYKPVENIRQTRHALRFDGRAIGCATATLPSSPGRRSEEHTSELQSLRHLV